MPPTAGELLEQARRRLLAAPFAPPPREASLLLGRVLGSSEAALLARRDEPVAAADATRFEHLLARRLRGEPVAYLLGEKEFYGRSFRVDRRVLIPRPETEHLVEAALSLDLPPRPRILDLGTGSGCLAVTLALEMADARLVAVDLSPGALALAATNVGRHGLGSRIALLASDLATALALGSFDLAVSNPPYVAERDRPSLSPEVRDFEPPAALYGGPDGSRVLRRLLVELAGLRGQTPLLMEIGYGQRDLLADLAARSPFQLLETRSDLAGIPRVAVLRRR